MSTRSFFGVLTSAMVNILTGKNAKEAAKLREGLGRMWQIGAGRRSNHLPGGRIARGSAAFRQAIPKFKWEGKDARPARSYRAARQNDAWARKDVGNTKPADRQALLAYGRA